MLRTKFVENFAPIRYLGYQGITLYPYIFLAGSFKDSWGQGVVQHEICHVYQIWNVGFFSFYFTYLYNYLKGIVKYRDHAAAYYNIPAEAEAYANSWRIGTQQLFEVKSGRRL